MFGIWCLGFEICGVAAHRSRKKLVTYRFEPPSRLSKGPEKTGLNMQTKTNMKRNLLTLATAGAIALGGFALVNAQDGDGFAGHGWHGHQHQFALQHLTKSLNLTPDQQAKVQPLIDQARPQIIAIHKDAMQKTQAIMDKTMAQIRPMLTADQQAKFDALQKARQDMRNAMQEMHSAMTQ